MNILEEAKFTYQIMTVNDLGYTIIIYQCVYYLQA
jgi:hypothetical protein